MIEKSVQVDILPACRAAYPGRSFDDLTDEEIRRAIRLAADRMGETIEALEGEDARRGRECREFCRRIPRPEDYLDDITPKASA